MSKNHWLRFLSRVSAIFVVTSINLLAQESTAPAQLPNGRVLAQVPGNPREINNLPTAAAVSPDGHFAVFLHSGFGAYANGGKQSLSVLNLETNQLSDFPENRLGRNARQTYFLGLAFSLDGKHLYASIASYTDPLGKKQGSTGNGIAIYSFGDGQIVPERFLKLPPRTSLPPSKKRREQFKDVTYPAGLSVGNVAGEERILVACNNSDEAVLLNASDGKIIYRFDLSTYKRIPASLPYTTVITNDGKRAFVSLWNASTVAELDLAHGKVLRKIELGNPGTPLAGGSHPTALLLNRDNSVLFVALTNRDQIIALDPHSGKTLYTLSTKPAGQSYGGSDPQSLALSLDEKTLFSANAIPDSVSVFNLDARQASGFIPTEWYPTVVVATSKDLLIASAKGRGAGPNNKPRDTRTDGRPEYPYILGSIRGSLARLPLADIPTNLAVYTREATERNAQRGNTDHVPFASGENKIRHVIYIIKENRTFDQVFGDLGVGNC